MNLRAGRLGSDVVGDSVDTGNLVRNPRRDLSEHGRGEVEPAGKKKQGNRDISTRRGQTESHHALTTRPDEKGVDSPIGRHKVIRRDRPQRNHLIVRPLVSRDSDRLDRQQRRERLRDLVVQTSGSDLLDVDGVGLLEEGDLLSVDRSQDSDRETGSGEGVSADEVGGDAEETTEGSDLV